MLVMQLGLVYRYLFVLIDEALRAFTDLCLFDLSCDAVVMNRLLPQAALREEFFAEWGHLQEERRREVAELRRSMQSDAKKPGKGTRRPPKKRRKKLPPQE